jgi:tetratricopeptide (TPR) repeat protein
MVNRCIVLILTVASCAAVPKSSRKHELQRLVPLPRIEFAAPLEFDRNAGFVVFPDANSAAVEAMRVLRPVKGVPDDAVEYLLAARVYQRGKDVPTALRTYARATELFRRKLDIEPEDIAALAGITESLSAFGKFAEALVHLEKALSLGPNDPKVALAAARYYKERAWQTLAGDRGLFSSVGFIDALTDLMASPPDAARRTEGKRLLFLAATALERAAALKPDAAEVSWERSIFLAFRAALEEALFQVQSGEYRSSELRAKLFEISSLADLRKAADSADATPEMIGAAAFATLYGDLYPRNQADDLLFGGVWPNLTAETQSVLRKYGIRLEKIALSGQRDSAAAAELLGCVRFYLLKDSAGGQRSFRQALSNEPKRHRSWELLVLATASTGDAGQLLEACQSRAASLPGPRSSVMLAKAYDRNGDSTRAEWTALNAASAYPNDFLVNLSLAALLLKRDNAESFLWRVQEAVTKAEKQFGSNFSRQNHIDFVLIKSIYLAMADQTDQARAVLKEFSARGNPPPEIQELTRLLD